MAEHTVICRDCEEPRRWLWLCEHCATECADNHRHETGHQPELRITQEPTAERLINDCRTMRLTQRRGGW